MYRVGFCSLQLLASPCTCPQTMYHYVTLSANRSQVRKPRKSPRKPTRHYLLASTCVFYWQDSPFKAVQQLTCDDHRGHKFVYAPYFLQNAEGLHICSEPGKMSQKSRINTLRLGPTNTYSASPHKACRGESSHCWVTPCTTNPQLALKLHHSHCWMLFLPSPSTTWQDTTDWPCFWQN